jgi:hypothetical protein
MATPSPAQPDEDVRGKHQRSERQAAVIAAYVLNALGEPPDFRRVIVLNLWGNRFRVNVQTGEDALCVRIAHSFFITADEGGQGD